MKNLFIFPVSKVVFTIMCSVFYLTVSAQEPVEKPVEPPKPPSEFWKHVQFGGGLGVGVGSGYTDITVAPSAIYNFNQYVALGVGAQYTYVEQKQFYSSHLYGGSIIGLFAPIEEIQLSVEVEQLRVNYDLAATSESRDFWNTGVFLGGGYRSGNATIGVRYNVLFNKNDNVYGDAFMPFIRVYF
ncbi:hypothetical protein [Flavobacterium sp. GT3R68]|uniref:hypothetical protein n=1 Tax=Flavobacterium sp. GT3R68 TaxID=2594437 RepID=UPI00163D843F|nr:hypothetical protein [Flavobacterium sp. GT3R68]